MLENIIIWILLWLAVLWYTVLQRFSQIPRAKVFSSVNSNYILFRTEKNVFLFLVAHEVTYVQDEHTCDMYVVNGFLYSSLEQCTWEINRKILKWLGWFISNWRKVPRLVWRDFAFLVVAMNLMWVKFSLARKLDKMATYCCLEVVVISCEELSDFLNL